MKKIKLAVSILCVLSFSFISFNYLKSSNATKIQAAPPKGYLDILEAPNVNIVDGSGTDSEIPGEFGMMFKLTKNVSYEVKGLKDPVNDILVKSGTGIDDPDSTKIFRFSPDNKADEKSVLIKNAGLYHSRSVDLKLVIDSMDVTPNETTGEYPYVNFTAVSYNDKDKTDDLLTSGIKTWGEAFLMLGSSAKTNSGYNDSFETGDKVDYHYEFFDSETGAAIPIEGTWNFNNINGLKAVTTDFDGDFKNIYVLENTWIGYLEDTPTAGKLELYGDKQSVNNESSLLTQLFSGSSFYTSMERRTYNSNNADEAKAVSESGPMAILYGTRSLARLAPSIPIVYGEKNDATHTDTDYLNLKYSILQTIPDNKLENRDSSFKIETEVPSFYDIDLSEVKVLEYGTDNDWTHLFKMEKDPSNASKLILTADLSTPENSEDFNGKVFDIKINAKANESFEFDKDAASYGYDDKGYLNFEMGGPKTSATYTYNTTGGDVLSKKLESEVIENQTKSQVLYEGVPDADPKQNINIPLGTNFTTDYPDPGTSFLENIRVDTDNDIDKPVTVTYSENHSLPDTSTLGEKSLWLTLTTAKGVTKDIEVTVTVVPSASNLTVKFLLNGKSDENFPDIVESHMVDDDIDLTTHSGVQKRITEIQSQGFRLDKAPDDEKFKIPAGGITVTYEFIGDLELSSAPKEIDFGVNKTGFFGAFSAENPSYDLPLIVRDNRPTKTDWELTVKVTEVMNYNDGGEVHQLPEALFYKSDEGEEVLELNQPKIITTKDKQTGTGLYNVSQEEWEDKQNGFLMKLPASQYRKMGQYNANILFTIGETP